MKKYFGFTDDIFEFFAPTTNDNVYLLEIILMNIVLSNGTP
jgi:hypothetical protein